ncbi:LrgB family protein [Pelagibaculum spongiae]|uniref:CidB/LrgB family autolysis modulator n=1 Tax=Pelagibaculum spongiae TaxID=2080658 RepID=A0A2V1GUK1_9GAMM|nr:LrgB family protein [Pelagibaculum spongiae]PVZ68327.1 hypothetical protein DC094_13665 [Pelagibaculum spongiae]
MTDFWTFPGADVLLYLLLTLLAYLLGEQVYQKANRHPMAHPVITAMLVIIPTLVIFDTDYQDYFKSTELIHFFLGPATVALAVPLFTFRAEIRRNFMPILIACFAGGATAAASAVAIGYYLGADHASLMSLAPKSVTTPIAMGVAEKIGGLPSLAAGFVVLTGVFGGVVGIPILRRLKIRDQRAQGFALGVAAHGFGTATAFEISEKAGAWAGLALGLTGLFTALIIPFLVPLLLPA